MKEEPPGSSLSFSDTVPYVLGHPLFSLPYQLSIESPPFQSMTLPLPKNIPPALNPKKLCFAKPILLPWKRRESFSFCFFTSPRRGPTSDVLWRSIFPPYTHNLGPLNGDWASA